MTETLRSPKVASYQYKPIFSFIFYLVSFLTLKKLSDQYHLRYSQSRRGSASTNSSRQKSPLLLTRQFVADSTRRSTDRNATSSNRNNSSGELQPPKNIANQIL